jgi:arginyl-tRNA synthetase
VITADLAAALGVGAGPAPVWRKPPPHLGAGPGRYATALPFALAARTGQAPETIAAQLAGQLSAVPWIATAQASGGHLSVAVTPARLAGLPARIIAAAAAIPAPRLPDLSAEPGWEQAWRSHQAALSSWLGDVAARAVPYFISKINLPPSSAGTPGESPVAVAVARFGVDAVRFALASTAAPDPAVIKRQLERPLDVANPFVLGRHAHADAASTVRWGGELGVARRPASKLAELQPAELALIDLLSWLPERLAAAHRTRRPADLAAYLAELAGAWLDCAERCPALSFRGSRAPAADDDLVSQRLELAEAAGLTLAAGLSLLGVAAPARI